MTLVAESSTGVSHAYTVTYGMARTLCGRHVPKANGWFGPIQNRMVDCARCAAALNAPSGVPGVL